MFENKAKLTITAIQFSFNFIVLMVVSIKSPLMVVIHENYSLFHIFILATRINSVAMRNSVTKDFVQGSLTHVGTLWL